MVGGGARPVVKKTSEIREGSKGGDRMFGGNKNFNRSTDHVQKQITPALQTFQEPGGCLRLKLHLMLPPRRVTALTLTHHILQAVYAEIKGLLGDGV